MNNISHAARKLLAAASAAIVLTPLSLVPASASAPGNTIIVAGLYFSAQRCGPAALNSYPKNLCRTAIASVRDPLGYYSRECDSYVAWMETEGAAPAHVMLPFSVLGTGGYWPQRVPPSWLVSWPQPGDIAIVPADLPAVPGHSMYVVANSWHGLHDLVVESYNEGGLGTYALQVWRPSGTINGVPVTLQFIHFPVLTKW